MIRRFFFIALLVSYVAVLIPFTTYLKKRPVAVKMGYLPDAEILKVVSGDQRTLLAELAVVKVLFYFGTLVEKSRNKIVLSPEYYNMFKTLETAIKLDPYNMDSYYFAQAAFTWEVGKAKDVNRLLSYGMKYRSWDWYLPFYAGFNSAYFLKDYAGAAQYMKRAAEISGDPLFTTLASRYFYEAGRAELGILFLDSMEKNAKDKQVKDIFAIRRRALNSVQSLTVAVQLFQKKYKTLPAKLSDLVAAEIITSIPDDPYGGKFYLDADGTIRSTSKFAFGRENQ